MIACTCMVQEGQAPDAAADALRVRLDAFSRRAFGAPMEIRWLRITPGNGFTAGAPSTSSIVSIEANAALDQTQREALMKDVCDLWMDETDCSLDEIVAVLTDPRGR